MCFWNKSAKLQPLYQFENVKEGLKDEVVESGDQGVPRSSVSKQGMGGGGVKGDSGSGSDEHEKEEGEIRRQDMA